MNVLITGGSGVLGYNLAYSLRRDEKFKKIVLVDLLDAPDSVLTPITFHKMDIRDMKKLNMIMKDIDVVVHAASPTPANTDAEIFDINVHGTENIFNLCIKNNIKRLVYISSTSVYGIPKKSPVLESDPVQYYDAYNKSKIAAEEICAAYRKKGMIVSVLRPRTFVGPGRLGTFSMLFEWASEKRNFPILGKGHNRYQFLDVEDLCRAIYLCITGDDKDVNDTFNIGAAEFGTFMEDYQAVLDVAGYGKKIIRLPFKPALFILRILAFFKLIPLYERLYKKVNMDYFVSIRKAEEKLGFSPLYSNKESLVRAYKWYLNNFPGKCKNTGLSNSCPWKQGALKLVKIFF